jgi:phosphoribosylglycinamide formyltransferase-1
MWSVRKSGNIGYKNCSKECKENGVNIVALAGYLRLFPVSTKDPYIVLNSHPAAIPYFGGKGMWGHYVHDAVIKWAKRTGFRYPYTFSTIHIASSEYDMGKILGLIKCKIEKTDTAETLSHRLLPLEHRNYIEVLKSLSQSNQKTVQYPREFLDLIES